MAKNKSKKQILPIEVNYTAMVWCINYGYRVYPIPQESCKGRLDCNEYKILIELANKKKLGTKTYTRKETESKIWEIYSLLFNKHKQNEKKK